MLKKNETTKNLPKTLINETLVEVHMPSCVQIELVQGNELRHYEIFFSMSSLTLSIAVGLWTGYITTAKSSPLFWSALSFSLLAIVTGVIAFYYRSKLYNGKIKKVATLNSFQDQL